MSHDLNTQTRSAQSKAMALRRNLARLTGTLLTVPLLAAIAVSACVEYADTDDVLFSSSNVADVEREGAPADAHHTTDAGASPALLTMVAQSKPQQQEVEFESLSSAIETHLKSTTLNPSATHGPDMYRAQDVAEAVLVCMRSCGPLGEVTDESRTCELRCANSARSPSYDDDCTVACTTQMYTCRADCSRDVSRPGDVATCGLNCAEVAKICLEQRCESPS